MSSILIEKLRKARQSNITESGLTFTVKRPTDLEMLYFRGQRIREGDLLEKFVVGWNLKEINIIPGGTDVPIDFDTDLFIEWIADRPDLWSPLCQKVMDLYRLHEIEVSERLGKPLDG